MKVKRRDIDFGELTAILERSENAPLGAEERGKLKAALDTLAFLTEQISTKGTTIERLRRMLFGASTEKTANMFADPPQDEAAVLKPGGGAKGGEEGRRRAGHGRNGADAFSGTQKVLVPHTTHHHGDRCPECLKGKLYLQAHPQVLIRIRAVAPLSATRYHCERLRCNLCGEVFTAEAPAGVGSQKYDESAAAMVALLKYGLGLPFNRIEKLQRHLGIPMPAATQWELVEAAATQIAPVHTELIRQAAQGELLHNDDTTAKIL
jgi:transposase